MIVDYINIYCIFNIQLLVLHCFGATGATIGAPFANQQILGLHCFGATEATIGVASVNVLNLFLLYLELLKCS